MCRGGRGRPAHRGSAQGCRGRTWGGGIACSGGGPLAQGTEGVAEAVTVERSKPGFGEAKLGFGDDRGGVGGIHTERVARGAGWGSEAGLRLACPLRSVRRNTLFLDGFDPRQIRPRLPAPGRRVAAPAQAGAAGFTNVGTVAGPLPTGLRPPATARRGFHRKPRRSGRALWCEGGVQRLGSGRARPPGGRSRARPRVALSDQKSPGRRFPRSTRDRWLHREAGVTIGAVPCREFGQIRQERVALGVPGRWQASPGYDGM